MAKKKMHEDEEHSEKSKHWIKGAIKRPGALHRALHVPEGEKIPAKKLEKASHAKGRLGKEARLAETLKGLPRHHGARKGRHSSHKRG